MIRLALPKSRNLAPTLAVLAAAGVTRGLAADDRRLRLTLPAPELPGGALEVLLLKDWDLPLYVAHGIADLGVVGSDVLEEQASDLLVPLRWRDGRSRMSLIGRPGVLPTAGAQVRLATKYPRTAREVVSQRPFGAEILELSGSIELAPVLGLAELALDIVQTGRTLAENGLVELERVREVAPCLVLNRAAWQRQRSVLNPLLARVEAAIAGEALAGFGPAGAAAAASAAGRDSGEPPGSGGAVPAVAGGPEVSR
jgi:ATP phosphoribosyltransferase